jgi:SAM-dependent methyltransferase
MTVDTALRPDAERLRAVRGEPRDSSRLLAHFLIERELAARLLAYPAGERASRYPEIYSELFSSVADHPQHSPKRLSKPSGVAAQLTLLMPHARPDSVFVEMGCGDASVAMAMAPMVREAIGVDVTGELIAQDRAPANFRFAKTGGILIPIETGSAGLVYSNQLMEHLHPDDAAAQLAEIHRILAPGGIYICITPNRLTGPHDISCYFGYQPQGLHLREYDHGTLAALFRAAGFRTVKACLSLKGRHALLPLLPVRLAERALESLPERLRTRIGCFGPAHRLAGVILVGYR